MFQKFYEDTLGSRFIKSLLNQTRVPLFKSVVDGDHLIENFYYVYKSYIIKCQTSGILNVSELDELYPSDKLYPSVFLYPGTGYKTATFYVIDYVYNLSDNLTTTYMSKTNYYDSETHKMLGNYLRYLNSRHQLNLLPYYNCFCSQYFDDILLTKEGKFIQLSRQKTSESYVIAAVPILYGKTYTIAIDCPFPVYMRTCYHFDDRVFDESRLSDNTTNLLNTSGRYYSMLNFHSPVTYRIETSDPDSYNLERYMYLVIQLPKNCDSSIVVLENYENSEGVAFDKNYVRKLRYLNPKLLAMNTRCSYAFSDRLVEYLVHNVVSKLDSNHKNIIKIQNIIREYSKSYDDALYSRKHLEGIYDNDLSRLILEIAESSETTMFDQDGFVNVDIERALLNKGIDY